jgi:hypothetical protein
MVIRIRQKYPSDFGVIGAEETLKDKLQKYYLAVSNSKPHEQVSRAKCNHSLWSQVDTPCYVYLSDVSTSGHITDAPSSPTTWEAAFRKSRWFRRG